MREPGGYQIIIDSMSKPESKHKEHIKVYGDDNVDRLTGKHETSMDVFSYGVMLIEVPQLESLILLS